MIYFYNNFHNGDIHYSRTFVKDIMSKLGDNDYCYLHNCDPSILKDIKKLKHDNSFISFDNWNLISDYPIKHNSQIIRTNDEINKTFITISDNIYDSYYFESKSEMLHLIDHNMDKLYEILKNKQ